MDHELQQTRVRIKAAGDRAVAAVLKLRADYLDPECERAARPNRDEDFWVALSGRLSTLGKPASPATAARLAAAGIDGCPGADREHRQGDREPQGSRGESHCRPGAG